MTRVIDCDFTCNIDAVDFENIVTYLPTEVNDQMVAMKYSL